MSNGVGEGYRRAGMSRPDCAPIVDGCSGRYLMKGLKLQPQSGGLFLGLGKDSDTWDTIPCGLEASC